MPTGILDEFDKMVKIPSNITVNEAISIIDKMEKYIPIFFSRNSYGDRIAELYRFEKDNNSVLVNIPICDCENAIREYKKYSDGMLEVILDTDEYDDDPYDMGVVYDRDVIFVNNCFKGDDRICNANVGQALNQFETLIRVIPDLKTIKEKLMSVKDRNCNKKFVSIYCHSLCSFYKNLILEILNTFISLDSAQRNPRNYCATKKHSGSKVSTGRKAR